MAAVPPHSLSLSLRFEIPVPGWPLSARNMLSPAWASKRAAEPRVRPARIALRWAPGPKGATAARPCAEANTWAPLRTEPLPCPSCPAPAPGTALVGVLVALILQILAGRPRMRRTAMITAKKSVHSAAWASSWASLLRFAGLVLHGRCHDYESGDLRFGFRRCGAPVSGLDLFRFCFSLPWRRRPSKS